MEPQDLRSEYQNEYYNGEFTDSAGYFSRNMMAIIGHIIAVERIDPPVEYPLDFFRHQWNLCEPEIGIEKVNWIKEGF
jgi:hypothetical protein